LPAWKIIFVSGSGGTTRMKSWPVCLFGAVVVFALLPGCRQQAPGPQTQDQAPAAMSGEGEGAGPAAPALQDTIETDPRYIVGISYPPAVNRYPGLAAELRRFSEAARSELMEAVSGLDQGVPASPYDLALSYTLLAETPRVVAVAADGSTYTGGAHGTPLVARFVWLPERNELLRPEALIPDPQGWRSVSGYVREQLHAALSQRVDADDLAPAERVQVVRAAGRMIEEGSEPDPDNFRQFEPALDANGRLRALRFVFPPYQVGPYADGVQTVEVPAAVLLPHVAAAYRDLFAGA
jgi:hypothetical protein